MVYNGGSKVPYGIKGETPEQTKWLEKCVGSITGTNKRTDKPYTKDEKIAICKVQLRKHGTSEAISEESIREQFYNIESKIYTALAPDPVIRESPLVVDIFNDYVIVGIDEKLYKIPYVISEDDVVFNWSASIEVKRITSYEPVSTVTKSTANTRGRVVTYGGRTIN